MRLVKDIFLCPKCDDVLYYDEDSFQFVCLKCSSTYGLDEIFHPFIKACLALSLYIHECKRFLPKKRAPFKGAKALIRGALAGFCVEKALNGAEIFETIYYHLVQLNC